MPTSAAASKTSARQPSPETQEMPGGVRHLPHVPVPHVAVPHVSMPTGTTGRVLWWGGLATVAAFGIVDWPVAALVAAGSWVAEQYSKQSRTSDGEQKHETEQ